VGPAVTPPCMRHAHKAPHPLEDRFTSSSTTISDLVHSLGSAMQSIWDWVDWLDSVTRGTSSTVGSDPRPLDVRSVPSPIRREQMDVQSSHDERSGSTTAYVGSDPRPLDVRSVSWSVPSPIPRAQMDVQSSRYEISSSITMNVQSNFRFDNGGPTVTTVTEQPRMAPYSRPYTSMSFGDYTSSASSSSDFAGCIIVTVIVVVVIILTFVFIHVG